MLDVLFIFTMIVFFALALIFIYGCDWFIKDATNAISTRAEYIENMGERGSGQGQTI